MKMKDFLNDFKAFAFKGNMMDLAIGMIIGAALAIAAVMLGVLFFPISQPVAEELPSPSLIVSTDLDSSYSDTLDRYIESMSDEELAGWVELSENDI